MSTDKWPITIKEWNWKKTYFMTHPWREKRPHCCSKYAVVQISEHPLTKIVSQWGTGVMWWLSEINLRMQFAPVAREHCRTMPIIPHALGSCLLQRLNDIGVRLLTIVGHLSVHKNAQNLWGSSIPKYIKMLLLIQHDIFIHISMKIYWDRSILNFSGTHFIIDVLYILRRGKKHQI